jgi:hypothetical protein
LNFSTLHGALKSSEHVVLLSFAPEGTAQPAPRETEFRAVQGGSTEMASGEVLLVEAYAGLWVILLAFLLISWRRQTRLDARMAELERSLAQHGAK